MDRFTSLKRSTEMPIDSRMNPFQEGENDENHEMKASKDSLIVEEGPTIRSRAKKIKKPCDYSFKLHGPRLWLQIAKYQISRWA